MGQVTLRLEHREQPWTLVIEPWALAYDVPPRTPARIDITTTELPCNVDVGDIADGGVFLAFEETEFSVRIGEEVETFKFPIRPRMYQD